MSLRSKLFATVALPVMTLSFAITPASAASGQATWLMAQALEGDLDGDGQLSEEELLLLQQQQQQQQAPAEEPAPAPEEQPAPPAEEPAPPTEEPAPPAEEPAPPAEEPAPPAEEPAPPAEEPAPPAEEPAPPAEEPAPPAEEPAPPSEEPAPPAEEPAAPAEEPAAPAEEPAAPAEEPAPAPAEETPPAEEQPAPAPEDNQQAPADEQTPAPATEDGQQAPAPEDNQQAPATDNTDQNGAANGEAPAPAVADQPLPEIPDTMTSEEKQQIAEDPSKTTDTVVLPEENGAAVLDSDKDADLTGGDQSRELRAAARSQEVALPPPTTDAEALQDVPVVEPAVVEAVVKEEGTKLDAAPMFAVPGVTNITNNVTNNNVTNNVTNNTTNNTVVNNVTQINQVNQVTVVNQVENTTVLSVGNQYVVRSDDRPRLRMQSSDTYYENLSRGRVRETIERPDGSRLVTVYNAFGDIILRSRITPDGDEYVMIYAPDADSEAPRRIYDAGYDLPPMRLMVPLDDYIVSTSRKPRFDYYDFLERPPVERVERVYSLDEVKYSARIRDKVRRIDLDTITFSSGSSEVPLSQGKSLRKVADAMLKVLRKDPGETFLIEGHTDAVGSAQSNLVLSDKRAASVAELLTDLYGIPPENLATQGYGERYLKIRTSGPEQQNRRVTIRRVTPLIRPIAQR